MGRICSIFLILSVVACSKDQTNRNPYLQDIGFRYDINLNLPLYSTLTNPGSAIYLDNQAVGTRGVFVMNTGFSQYRAFEGSCPNHAPSNCSTMLLDGQNAVCPCDDYSYSLFTGQFLNRPDDGNRYYDMLEYRATANGNIVVISN